MAVLPTGFGKNLFDESVVILKDTSDSNQMSLIVAIVPCLIITEDHIRSNDYLWLVAFEKKGNLWKVIESSFLQNKLCTLTSLIYSCCFLSE